MKYKEKKSSISVFTSMLIRGCNSTLGHSIFFDYKNIGYFRYEAVLTWFSDFHMVYIQDIDGKEIYGCCFDEEWEVYDFIVEFMKNHNIIIDNFTSVYIDAEDYERYRYK